MICNSVVRSVINKPVCSIQDFVEHVAQARRDHQAEVEIRFAKLAVRSDDMTDILQLHFDQLSHLNQLHVELREPTHEVRHAFLNFTCAQLRKQEDYQEWRTTEWSQLNKYEIQGMFGAPIPRPFLAIILPFVWTYLMKEDPITGILRGNHVLPETAGRNTVRQSLWQKPCVEQPACRVYWTMTRGV